MSPHSRPNRLAQAFSCWNWKCALLSATARSLVYLAAMARNGLRGSLAMIAVEIVYVTLTAGVYAGMQQKALGLRSRQLSNFIVVFVVPGLAQGLDWIAHRFTGTTATGRTILAVSLFAVVSALFHLHVMRSGVLLTGHGRSLSDDFRRMPGLIAGFLRKLVSLFAGLISRSARTIESEAAL